MRPVLLELEGFRSHSKKTEIDFTARSFIAITGPIGSGKSTILDAISYALYGRTAREQRNKKRLISSRDDVARVRLTFAIDDHIFEVTRALPRKGSGEHVLVDRADDERIIGDTAVTARIEELLGLDFGGFCSSVLLAQGRFSKFLEATPTDRGKILKGIFRLDRIDELRDAAKSKVGELALQLKRIEGELDGIPADIDDLLGATKELQRSASERARALEKALPEEESLQCEANEISLAIEEADKQNAVLAEIADELPPEAALEELARREGRATQEIADLKGIVKKASADAAKARKDKEAIEKKAGTEVELAALAARADELGRTKATARTLLKDLENLTTDLAKAKDAAIEADRAEASAAAAVAEVESARRDLENEHRAHALRQDLAAGEPCPVCEQKVAKVPRGKAPAALTALDRKETTARTTLEKARANAESARASVTRVEQDVTNRTAELERVTARGEELTAQLRGSLGATKDPIAEIERRTAALRDAGAAVDAADDALVTAEDDLDSAVAAMEDLATLRRDVAGVLILAAGKLELDPPGVDAPAADLLMTDRSVGATIAKRRTDLRDSTERSRIQAGEIERKLEKLRTGIDLDAERSIADALADARSEVGIAKQRIEDLTTRIARGKELNTESKTLTTRSRIYAQLADDLTDRHFIRFLLADRTRLLFEIASERLNEMTARYRFAIDDAGELDVIDELDGDKTRSVDTLSGGETFLASLALAIALAELVTREGGRLQCFFLDEGFGSLDAEAFDLALDGIEKIVRPDRLIGLVSHLPALSARVEDRIELAKDDEGTTVVVAGAGVGA